MEMFEHIGVAHRIEEVSLPCPGNVYHFEGLSDEDKPRTDFRQLPTRYPCYYKINQNDFERVLREHLLSHYGIVPEYGREFHDLRQDDDGVSLSIIDRATETPEAIRCSWVIGSDGAHSRVRDRTGIAFAGEQVGVMAMMDVELEDVTFDDTWVNYFIGEATFVLVTRLPGRLWRVYLSDAGAMTRADDPRGSFQAVADRLGVGITIGEPHWATQWEILNSQAERYRDGRVFLCGDASHVHSPAGGQGMNGCMQDAFNLCWKLAAVIDDAAPDFLLDTYEAERRPIGAQITAGAKATHDIVMAFGKGLEDRIAMTREPGWQKRVVDIVRHAGFTLLLIPRAGAQTDFELARNVSRAMQARYGLRVRSILISTEHVPGFDDDHVVPDLQGELAERYGIGPDEGRAVLIRPDMYVGAHCRLEDAGVLVDVTSQWLTARTRDSSSGRIVFADSASRSD